MSQNFSKLTKPELQKRFLELQDELTETKANHSLLTSNYDDLLASNQAYKMENTRLKDTNLKLVADNKELKKSLANEKNRANQIAHRKKELEHEISTYREQLDAHGKMMDSVVDKILSMVDLHFTNIKTFTLQGLSSSFPKRIKGMKKSLSNINMEIKHAKHEFKQHGFEDSEN